MKRFIKYCLFLFAFIFFSALWIPKLRYISETERLTENITVSSRFRRQTIDSRTAELIRNMEKPGEYLAVYWLESNFGSQKIKLMPEEAQTLRKRWEKRKGWGEYLRICQAVWDDLRYFPVAENGNSGISVSFEDSWMYERTYKEQRGHEGTDIMPDKNEAGVLPVVSMTDGIVQNKGWLELGGYRVGIRTSDGAYFYYAHLDSYSDIEIGDSIKAGDLLGFMGDTGYGTREGTRGKFPVHLHIGIYICHDDTELSVNPYAALKFLEEKRIDYQKR